MERKMNKPVQIIYLSLTLLALSYVPANMAKPSKHIKSLKSPVELHQDMNLAEVQKNLAHFAENEKNPEMAQLLTDLNRSVKRAKKNPASITKEELTQAFTLIEEATAKMSPESGEAAFSSSNDDKKIRKLLCEIKTILKKCCKHLSKEIEEIEKLISPCGKVHVIDHVPFTIDKDGKWCVKHDLTFSGSGAAITVAKSNVTINFNNHDLTITNPTATGISIAEVSEVVIENDKIIYSTPATAGAAIQILGSTKVTLDNILIQNPFDGVVIDTCSDVTLKNSQIREGSDSDINASNSNQIDIDNCYFFNTKANFAFEGMVFGGSSGVNQVRIANSTLNNVPILYFAGEGVTLENTTAIVDDPLFGFTVIQLGIPFSAGTLVTDIIVNNCKINATASTVGTAGFGAFQVKGLLIQNSIIDVNFSGVPSAPGRKAFLLGNDIKMINCVLAGTSPAIDIEDFQATNGASTGIVIEDNVIENFNALGITMEGNTSNVTIKNNSIRQGVAVAGVGSANAIEIHDNTNAIAILENVITANAGDGIQFNNGTSLNTVLNNVVSNNTGNGIFVDVTSLRNLVKNNEFFANGIDGINNVGDNADNQYYFNDACFNGATNCFGIEPSTLVGFPGDPTFNLGKNICCAPPGTPVVASAKAERTAPASFADRVLRYVRQQKP